MRSEKELLYDANNFENEGDLENCIHALREAIQNAMEDSQSTFSKFQEINLILKQSESLENGNLLQEAIEHLKSALKDVLYSNDDSVGTSSGNLDRTPEAKEALNEPGTSLSDVIGLEDVKNALHDIIDVDKEERMYLPYSTNDVVGILLFGPPGNGKSFLLRCLALDFNAKVFKIEPGQTLSRWMGESEQRIAAIFKEASLVDGISIIFIDEFDSFGSSRSGTEDSMRLIKNQLLIAMSGGDSSNRTIVIACTNLPDSLDPAFHSRFPYKIYVPLPTETERLRFFECYFTKIGHVLGRAGLRRLSGATKRFSYRELNAATAGIGRLFIAANRKVLEREADLRGGQNVKVPLQEMIRSIAKIKPTTSSSMLSEFESFNKRHGFQSRSICVPSKNVTTWSSIFTCLCQCFGCCCMLR